jgi:hypothetical protein
VSERFRKQLHYVLIGNHHSRWRRATANEVAPEVPMQPINEAQRTGIESIELY